MDLVILSLMAKLLLQLLVGLTQLYQLKREILIRQQEEKEHLLTDKEHTSI